MGSGYELPYACLVICCNIRLFDVGSMKMWCDFSESVEDHDSHVYDWQEYRWNTGAYFGGYVNYSHVVYTTNLWNTIKCPDFW